MVEPTNPDPKTTLSASDIDRSGPSPDCIAFGFPLEMLATKSNSVPKSWTKISKEVMWRKRLLMAATDELRQRGIPHDFTLATVDVFVEKAQHELSRRAMRLLIMGCFTAVLALALMGTAVVFLSKPAFREYVSSVDTRRAGEVVIFLFRASSVAGFYAGAIIFLIVLSRALLHEMVVLYQRRHALRFGRLFIYLHPENISVTELQAAFNWNAEYRSAFKDIKEGKILQTPLGKGIELITEAAETWKELAMRAMKKE